MLASLLKIVMLVLSAPMAEARKRHRHHNSGSTPPGLITSPVDPLLTQNNGLWFEYDFDGDWVDLLISAVVIAVTVPILVQLLPN